ncbi:MAG: chromosomal replication initiator protein DnaA [Candidatus Aureabacteria bacterium]|nr:chromosomal replication initiator protein DnaA [Candidatus Auribacterota bacterium]
MKRIWNKVLASLRDKHDETIFETWLAPVKYLSSTNNTVYLEVPGDLFLEWIKDHYLEDIKSLLVNFTGQEFDVRLVKGKSQSVDTSQKNISYSKAPKDTGTASEASVSPRLNPLFNFESFVVGSNNRLAHSAAVAVAQSPGMAYNPLFIYGGVGLGKTHLMQAVGHFVKQKNKNKKVVYITCEEFTNLLINSIQKGNTLDFRNKFRNIDILLIDDIQFLGKKESTQEEFFHTFNSLYDSHKQIVISSDKPPKEISNIEERLVSRFEWGLAADLQPPDFETRVAILQKKAEMKGINIAQDIINFIAETIKSNIRTLEGALVRVYSYSNFNEVPLDLDLAEEAIQDLIKNETSYRINIESIQEAVADFFKINVQDLRGKKRPRFIAFPRQIAMYLSRKHTDYSLPEIGRYFGGRDHTTVIHAFRKIEEDINKDDSLRINISKIEENINAS